MHGFYSFHLLIYQTVNPLCVSRDASERFGAFVVQNSVVSGETGDSNQLDVVSTVTGDGSARVDTGSLIFSLLNAPMLVEELIDDVRFYQRHVAFLIRKNCHVPVPICEKIAYIQKICKYDIFYKCIDYKTASNYFAHTVTQEKVLWMFVLYIYIYI